MSHFRFFDLPRELRDVIYDLLILRSKHIISGVDEHDTQIVTTNIPTPASLLSNKQLNAEYSDQLPSTRSLYVLGGHCDWWTGYPDVPSALARSITECVVYIHVHCLCDLDGDRERDEYFVFADFECDATDVLHNYRESLQEFLSQFPSLRSVHFNVGLFGDGTVLQKSEGYGKMSVHRPPLLNHSKGFPEALSMLVALPLEVKSLDVVRVESEVDYERYRWGDGEGLKTYFTWTREGGCRKGELVEEDE